MENIEHGDFNDALVLDENGLLVERNPEYEGRNGIVVLNENGIVIKRGTRWFFFGGGMLRGDKSIPHASITAIQFRKPWIFTVWYLQFTVEWWSEAGKWLFEAVKDENTITFGDKNNKKFEELKTIIESHINARSQKSMTNLDGTGRSSGPVNDLNAIEKLAELKEKGIVTQEEFDAKKKSLLGL